MWNSVGCLWSGSLYSAGSYYISIRRKLAAGSLVRDVRGNPAWRHHRDFRLPFGMEAHSLSAFPLPSAMEPVSRSDISFHSQWTRRTQPVSSFHLEWKPIPELLPAFHPQWNPISERNIDFHSQWISHSVLSGRSIHDGSRVLLPHPACQRRATHPTPYGEVIITSTPVSLGDVELCRVSLEWISVLGW